MSLVDDLRTLLHSWTDTRVSVEEHEGEARIHTHALNELEIDSIIDALHEEGLETERVKEHGSGGVTVGVIVHASDTTVGLSQADYQAYQEEVEQRFHDSVSN